MTRECPACGEHHARPCGRKRGYVLHACEQCRTAFVDPLPAGKQLAEIYSKARGYFATAPRDLAETSPDKARWLDRLARVHGATAGQFLDVGCATGQLMFHMRSLGWQVEGLDLNAGAVEVATANGLLVKNVAIEEATYAGCSFDLVFLGDVIEHVLSPELTLNKVHDWLKPGGLVVMRTPNVLGGFARASAWIARLTGTQWAHAEAPFHLAEFSEEGLKRLLERTGFETLGVSSSGSVPFAYRVGASGYFDELKAHLKRGEQSWVRLILPKLPALVGVTCLVGIAHIVGWFMGGMQSMTAVGRRNPGVRGSSPG